VFPLHPDLDGVKGYGMSVATAFPVSQSLDTMDLTSINTIRTLAMDGVQAANSENAGVLLMAQDAAQWGCNLASRKRSGGDLIEQWLKQVVVVPIDKRYVNRR
jgi:hypothetical protein